MFHPEYPWYKILSVLLFLSLFKRFMDSIVTKAKMENKQRKDREVFAGMVAQSVRYPYQQQPQKSNNVITYWLPLAVGIICIILGVLFLVF
ncbi:hypothetical protein CUN85_06475 [Methanolobus halotolerans]|uniref:Uncharacterized protein n=1 Tax=Methanolobus halotolerans TaxID=2052935 RepID=A0A4E0Q5L2_9EURY|nr:hypothetical protein CUN85_06475 [Methanolobus halotolerans]